MEKVSISSRIIVVNLMGYCSRWKCCIKMNVKNRRKNLSDTVGGILRTGHWILTSHSQRRSCHDSVQYTLSSYEVILSLIPGQNVWCWWWAVWNLTRRFQSARFSPLSVIPPKLYKQILLMYQRRCVFSASDRVLKYITLLCPYLILFAVILEELSKN